MFLQLVQLVPASGKQPVSKILGGAFTDAKAVNGLINLWRCRSWTTLGLAPR